MTKEELETAIKLANLNSGRSTLLLAIGILGEYVGLPFLETKWWYKPTKIVFAVLVVAGIVGEYEFSSRISQYADELQRLSDREIAKISDTSKGFDSKIAEAQRGTAEAQRDSQIARKNGEQLKVQSAQLTKENLTLQADLLKLRERVAWRRIDKEQYDRAILLLKPYAGASVVLRRLEDAEAATFADDTEKLLTDSGWRLTTIRIGLTTPTYGLLCTINTDLPAGKSLEAAVAPLKSARIVRNPQLQGSIAQIFVGLRLPP